MDNAYERHRSSRQRFTEAADAYRLGRPGYPPATFDLLAERCGLGPGTQVLEVGPGSGQATEPMLDRGARVHAIELGAEFAADLRTRFAGRDFRVDIAAFEDAPLPDGQYDLATAATSFHWVPTEAGHRRCAAALRSGGWLAHWWTLWGDPDRADPFNDALMPILERHAPQLHSSYLHRASPDGPPYALDTVNRIGEIDRSEAYGPVEHHQLAWTASHTAAQMRALFATFAPWLELDEPLRSEMLDAVAALVDDEFGGKAQRPYVTAVYLACRQ